MSAVGLRLATPADSEFCFHLHKAAMGDYVAAVRGWDETDQRDYHESHFDPDRWQIITIDGTDAGILIVEYSSTEVYLGHIELHPRYQGRGMGTQLIQSLIDTAAKRDQDLLLDAPAVGSPRERHLGQCLPQPAGINPSTGHRGVEAAMAAAAFAHQRQFGSRPSCWTCVFLGRSTCSDEGRFGVPRLPNRVIKSVRDHGGVQALVVVVARDPDA